MPLSGERKPRSFLSTASTEFGPEFSPDGKLIAYISDESGTQDVYLSPSPDPVRSVA